MKEFRILSPTGIVGYGFPEESFAAGVALKPDLIAGLFSRKKAAHSGPTSMYSDELRSYVFYPSDYSLDPTKDEEYMGLDRQLWYHAGGVGVGGPLEDDGNGIKTDICAENVPDLVRGQFLCNHAGRGAKVAGATPADHVLQPGSVVPRGRMRHEIKRFILHHESGHFAVNVAIQKIVFHNSKRF